MAGINENLVLGIVEAIRTNPTLYAAIEKIFIPIARKETVNVLDETGVFTACGLEYRKPEDKK